MTYREIQPRDIAALFKVRTATIENAFTMDALHAAGITEESVAGMLRSTHQGWLCEIEGQVVGFSMGDTSTGELWVIAVVPQYEGRGIGSRLLSLTEQSLWTAGAQNLWLVTSDDLSLRAHGFYRSCSWEDAGIAEGQLRMEKQKPDKV